MPEEIMTSNESTIVEKPAESGAALVEVFAPLAHALAENARHQSASAIHESTAQTKRLQLQVEAQERQDRRQFTLYAVLLCAIVAAAIAVMCIGFYSEREQLATHAFSVLAGLAMGVGFNRLKR